MIEMTAADYQATIKNKTNKYRNKKSGKFDSKKEEKRYYELILMQKAGNISDLIHHKKFDLIPKQDGERAIKYEADFVYQRNGVLIVEDVKSPATRKIPLYSIKRKLMLLIHGIKITEV